MYYETAQTIGPGWQKYFKPTHYKDMDWPPSSEHFRSSSGSPQSYRRIIHPEDSNREMDDEEFFARKSSPTFSRKIFRDVWDDATGHNHRFMDRPRMFKKVFKPKRWGDDDDDFERTRNTVRQLARDFESNFDPRSMDRNCDSDFDSRKMDRDFDSDFDARKMDRDFNSDFPHRNIDEEFQKASGKVHHIPIMVERRLDEMRSGFGKPSQANENFNYQEEADEWQGPQVQRLRKNFETDEDISPLNERHRGSRVDINKPRAFTCPMPTRWDSESVHTLPTRRSNKKSSKIYDEPQAGGPKSVYRSYSETHEDMPKHHHNQQQHATAFRSHSDGHCPKTTYVTKISVNLPSSTPENQNQMPNGDVGEEVENKTFENTNKEGLESQQRRARYKSQQSHSNPEDKTDGAESDGNNRSYDSSDEKPQKENKRTSLQQIASVMQNVDDLLIHVDGYNGTGRDKQFRFLDEMLTRCMLRLDDVDTEGREDMRIARKAAVMQVQSCIEKLEVIANECERARELQKNQQAPENGLQSQSVEGNGQSSTSDTQTDNQPPERPEVETTKEEPQTEPEQVSKEDNEQTRL